MEEVTHTNVPVRNHSAPCSFGASATDESTTCTTIPHTFQTRWQLAAKQLRRIREGQPVGRRQGWRMHWLRHRLRRGMGFEWLRERRTTSVLSQRSNKRTACEDRVE